MNDAFLKFANHEAALIALENAGVSIGEGETLTYRDTGLPDGMLIVKAVGPACDGVVYAPTGETVTGDEGFEYPLTAAVPGFHVNIRLDDGAALPEALEAFLVAPQPETPAEMFS